MVRDPVWVSQGQLKEQFKITNLMIQLLKFFSLKSKVNFNPQKRVLIL